MDQEGVVAFDCEFGQFEGQQTPGEAAERAVGSESGWHERSMLTTEACDDRSLHGNRVGPEPVHHRAIGRIRWRGPYFGAGPLACTTARTTRPRWPA